MKILMVKLSPVESIDSATLRTIAVTKGLVDLGHSIDYITIPTGGSQNTRQIDKLLYSINVIRTQKNEIYHSIIEKSNNGRMSRMILSFLRKIYHSFSLHDNSYSIAQNINIDILEHKEYDIIISSSDPKTSHIAVLNLIKQGLKYNKWIQYWGDPLANDITSSVIYPKSLLTIYEKNILKHADKIIYVSPITLADQQNIFPEISDRMNFIPIPYLDEKKYKKTNNEYFRIGYFGDYYSKVRSIQPLYDACSRMSDVNLTIMGDTDLKLDTTENIEIYSRGNCEIHEAESDLLVCVLNSRGSQIPGKIYHYSATNKAILVILDGEKKEELKKYLERFDRYILCENNPESITRSIKNIMQSNEKYYPCSIFRAEHIATEFIRICMSE